MSEIDHTNSLDPIRLSKMSGRTRRERSVRFKKCLRPKKRYSARKELGQKRCYICMRGSRNFRQGGPGQSDKKALTTFFFFFLSPQLILQKSNGQFQRNLSFSKVQEGVQHFPGGGGGSNFFQRGSNCLFPIETHITCDFPGGGWGPDPLSPLWIRT